MPKINLSLGFNAYKDRLKRKSDSVLFDFFVLLSLDMPLITEDEKRYLQKSAIYSSKAIKSQMRFEGDRIVQSIKERIEKIESNQRQQDFSSQSINRLDKLIKKMGNSIFSGQEPVTEYLELLSKKMTKSEELTNAEIGLLARKAELLSSPTLNLENESLEAENSDNEILLNNGVINESEGTFYDKNIPIN